MCLSSDRIVQGVRRAGVLGHAGAVTGDKSESTVHRIRRTYADKGIKVSSSTARPRAAAACERLLAAAKEQRGCKLENSRGQWPACCRGSTRAALRSRSAR